MLFCFLGGVSSLSHISVTTKWRQNGITIAGGNGKGDRLNQLSRPQGIYVDDDNQCIYIADYDNHRVVNWKFGENSGKIVAGGNGKGNRIHQLSEPTAVMVDKKNGSLIICDCGNRRVMRWSRQNSANGQVLLSDIDCCGLNIDNNENLYVSNWRNDRVQRWRIGETNGTLVAGGNGKGGGFNQLNYPTFIAIDEDSSVYVADRNNHRVTKWVKNANEGVVVAGEQGMGNDSMQLDRPQGVLVDGLGNVYVADSNNHRIMRWSQGAKQGDIIVGGNGRGQQPNQFNSLRGISFDRQGNLYIVDTENSRIQKFDIDIS